MAVVLILTASPGGAAEVLPGLSLLPHDVRVAAPEPSALLDAPAVDAVLLDARRDLAGARGLARLLRTTGLSAPLLAVVTEGGLVAVSSDWGLSDVVLDAASPAEVDARLRLAASRSAAPARSGTTNEGAVSVGDLIIDEVTYSARLRGRALELTFKEFELLKFLAQHPGRVFTRAQLLQEVWGYDYYGGTRTVDVHVRRLRAKLGTEHEQLIGTVRHVGYKFVAPPAGSNAGSGSSSHSSSSNGGSTGSSHSSSPGSSNGMPASVSLPA
jgi:DNA-binding response OmpR family regulator